MNQAIIDAKKALVSEIADKMKNAESAVVVEYRGLTVAEMTELRRNLRAEDVEFKVYKNAMAQRAAESIGADLPVLPSVRQRQCFQQHAESIGADGLKEVLVGPNAIAFGKDAVAPARVLAKFAKTHEALVLKSGIVEGNVVGVETIQKLSSLPNKDGMISMFLGCLQSPVIKFACAVKAVAESKEGSAEAAE